MQYRSKISLIMIKKARSTFRTFTISNIIIYKYYKLIRNRLRLIASYLLGFHLRIRLVTEGQFD